MTTNRSLWLPAILLVVALLFLLLSDLETFSLIEGALNYVIAPVMQAFSSGATALKGLTIGGEDVQALQRQVAELKQQNEVLLQENSVLQEFNRENQQLREQLEFMSRNPSYSVVGADVVRLSCTLYPCGSVIAKDTNPYLRYLIINIGSRHGLAVGMPVVSGGAVLIGRVARVSPNLAYVQLINDPQNQIAAMVLETRINGIVQGTQEGGLVLTDVLPDEEVNPGEVIVTSAIGGLLPRGLLLGQVDSVTYQESGLFKSAVLRPVLDFSHIEVVWVITNFAQPDSAELDALGEPDTP